MKKIVLYGAGNKALQLESIIAKYLPDVECNYLIENKQFDKIDTFLTSIHDSNKKMEIISLGKLGKLYQNKIIDAVAFPTSYHLFDWHEIVQLCKSAGISEQDIYAVPIDILKKNQLEKEEIDRILMPYTQLNEIYHLDIHITDHCNLKCKGCAHFAPLIDHEVIITEKQIEENLRRLKTLIPNICKIAVLGGEPLLNPQFGKILAFIAKTYPYAEIVLVTNGILLTQINEEERKIIRDNNILIAISLYPNLRDNLEKWISFCREHRLKYKINDYSTFERRLWSEPIFDGNKMTKQCGHDLCMSGRYIARCPMIAFIKYYNDKFPQKFPSDGLIDIYEVDSGLELIDCLNKASGLCDYCCARDHFYEDWELVTRDTIDETDWFMNIPEKLLNRGEQS